MIPTAHVTEFLHSKIILMELILTRTTKTENSTIGVLQINGQHKCFTLEDKDRGINSNMSPEEIKAIKVYGKTAIPTGRYKVTVTYSQRFKQLMPEVMNVPGFAGIRIHPGNTAANTEGCILVGEEKCTDIIYRSRLAYNGIWPMLNAANEKEESVYITIK